MKRSHLVRLNDMLEERTKGSHRIYVHPKVPRPLSIQPQGNEAKRYQLD